MIGKHDRDAYADGENFADGADVTTTITRMLQKQRKDKTAFGTEIKQAARVHGRARGALSRLFDDMRNGRKLDLSDTQLTVHELADHIGQNANAMLWLTNLRFSKEHNACHCLNTAIFAMVFGQHSRMSKSDTLALGMGAILHDLGKTGIPPLMLDKPAVLNDAEREVVRKHVDGGLAILQDNGDLPRTTLDIVRCHHERYDGSGYPDGLTGDRVPLTARIVGIADAYDSMVGDYGYRKPKTPVSALRELRTEAQDEFGEDVVREFTNCLGTYPVGSLVELNSGAVVMVVSSSKEARLKPLVMQLRNEEGKFERPRLLFDLSRYSEEQLAQSWGIKDAVDPVALNLDVTALLVEEIMAG